MGVDQAADLARHHLAATLGRRWVHVQAVTAEAERLCTALQLGSDPVIAAWLHDIGYAPTVAGTGFHPLDGARYLRTRGWADRICRLVAHHTNASVHADLLGFGTELRTEFPQPFGICTDVLWTADVTTGPNGERMTLHERIEEVARRYGAGSGEARSIRTSEPLLSAAATRVEARLLAVSH